MNDSWASAFLAPGRKITGSWAPAALAQGDLQRETVGCFLEINAGDYEGLVGDSEIINR